MKLPNRLFFTGVPGSRWSGISQVVETVPGFNISNRANSPEFSHHVFSGHKGTYFGLSQDWEARLDIDYIDSAWPDCTGTRLIKSHDWAYRLDQVWDYCQQNNDWLMLVYRPDMSSYAWWFEVGGFNITHPRYDHYGDYAGMLAGIAKENKLILEFAHKHNLSWHYFTSTWIEQTFGHNVPVERTWPDVLVAIIK
jgi:hypothetical protein